MPQKVKVPYVDADSRSPLETSDVDTMLGFDVNDFESRTYYAIFNDPDGVDMLDLPESLKPQLLDVPLYEDESLARVLQHAKLMNEDRAQMRPHRSPVIVREQTLLKTPWKTVPLEEEK